MSFGIPVRNGLSISLLSTTALSSGRRLIPALGLNFLSGTLDPRITFSRGSNATLTDSTGRLTYAPTNLLTNSESFDNAAWAKVAATVTANNAVAPDGSTTADALVEDGTTSVHYVQQFVSFTSGVSYTLSAYVKAGTRSWVQILFPSSAFTSSQGGFFNLSGAGSLGTAVGSPTSRTITAVGNGWYRISITATATTTAGGNVPITSASADNTASYAGTNGATALSLWGAQLSPVTYQTTPGTYNSTTPKNLLGFTQEFDNAAWTKSNATVTANAFLAPDGTLTADKLVGDTTTGTHRVSQVITTVNGTSMTAAVYVKAGEYTKFAIREGNFTGAYAAFDLSLGTKLDQGSGGTGTITSVGNGWYRVSMTSTTGGVSVRPDLLILDPTYTTGAPNGTWAANGTSGIYIWGAQLSDSASLDPYVYNPAAAAASAAYYGPRFDYDPVTLAAKGLLIEEARTNLATYSEQFDNASWTKGAATVTANATSSPDGTANADKVAGDGTSAGHYVRQTVTVSANTTYTITVYAKAAEISFGYISLGGTGAGGYSTFNYATGALGSLSSGIVSRTIIPVGNGWYRASVTITTGASVGSNYVEFSVAPTDTIGVTTTSGGIYFYGAQLEAGSFATSYIPTVASQVTRSADVATMIGDNFASWYNLNAGTFTWSYTAFGQVNNNSRVFSSGVGGSNSYGIFPIVLGTSQNTIYIRDISGDAIPGSAYSASTASGVVASGAAAYEVSNFAVASNGTIVLTASSGLPPSQSNQLRLGRAINTDGAYLNGHIRSLGYYNTRQPNATLQTLTNPSTTPSLALNFISDTYTVGA